VDLDEVASQASVPRHDDRRTWRLAGVLVLMLIVAAGVTIVLLSGKGAAGALSPAAQQFDAAYKTFHTEYDTHATALTAHMSQAGDALADPKLFIAAQDARSLANDYETYASAVKAIAMPSSATASQARIVQVADAGDFLMTQASGFFGKAGMQALLNEDWPQVRTELAKAEATTRSALGLSS
jgi:hypothetical protein